MPTHSFAQGGDSGEIVAEGCNFGVAHPPGYPLQTMLNFIVSRPSLSFLGSPAYRANLLCALFGGLGAFWLSRAAIHASDVIIAQRFEPYGCGLRRVLLFCLGALCAISWSLSPVVWRYSSGAEVFAFNNAICAAMLWLACRTTAVVHRLEAMATAAIESGDV